jgi:hypothetical protein
LSQASSLSLQEALGSEVEAKAFTQRM